MKFSIIIPVFNEEKNIQKLTYLIKKNLIKVNYEIIFVNDSSTDNTALELKKIRKKNINYITRSKKRDLSKSCIEGIKKSIHQNIIIMDGDLQHRPSCLKSMIKIFKRDNPDVLVGVRKLSSDEGLSFIRRNLSYLIIFIINNLLGKKTTDPMSGFFIIKKDIFIKSKKKLFNSGFKILADIIYSFKNLSIREKIIKFGKRKHNVSKMKFNIILKIIILIFFKMFQKKIEI